jgi:hypothetical protein
MWESGRRIVVGSDETRSAGLHVDRPFSGGGRPIVACSVAAADKVDLIEEEVRR